MAGKNQLFGDLGAQAQPQGQESWQSKQKECQRIWSAFTKFIRSQCNKNRVIDSQYFGAFFKLDEDTYCMTGLGKDAINEFKIAVNHENVVACPALGPEDGCRESATVNFGAISTLAGTTTEATHSFLSKLSELVGQQCLAQRK